MGWENTNLQRKDEIVSSLKLHKESYKSVLVHSVIAKREDLPDWKGKWHNYLTIAQLMNSFQKKSFKEHIHRDNFSLFQATISVDDLIQNLERLALNKAFKVGPFTIYERSVPKFQPEDFFDSERSRITYGVGWATSVWRVESRENLGIPSDHELELEREHKPFPNAREAIAYYFGLHDRYELSQLLNRYHILLLYYYAKIQNCVLLENKLEVEVMPNISKLSDLVLKYNCPIEGNSPLTGTVEVKTPSIKLAFETAPEAANVWLYQKEGYKVDYRSRVERTLNLKEVIELLSKRGLTYVDDTIRKSLTKGIFASSELFRRVLTIEEKTTEMCVDSVDGEILNAIKNEGRDYEKFIPAILLWLPAGDLMRRLGKLHALYFIYVDSDEKVALTPQGMDVLLLPPSTLITNVPEDVAKTIAEIRLALLNGNFDGVVNTATKMFEQILRTALEKRFGCQLIEKWQSMKMKPYNRAGLGVLKDACLKLKVFGKGSIPNKTLESFLRLRAPVSHEATELIDRASTAKMTLNLVEIFVRYWFYQTKKD